MVRKIHSYKKELAVKSREAMLSAVEIYNNPNIQFKSETFIILANIAWTYLLHAFYRSKNIDYHYYTKGMRKKRYDKTKYGAKKSWELERCLNTNLCPLDDSVKANLSFLIGIRNEIEHQMTTKIDDALSAKFQACCLNYNYWAKKLFGQEYGIDHYLTFSLQFSAISEPQKELLTDVDGLPKNIHSFIDSYEDDLDEKIFNDPKYSYRVIFVPKMANRKGQADKVIEFVKPGTEMEKQLNHEVVMIKEREKTKHLPGEIVEIMKKKGYGKMNMYHFAQVWRGKYKKEPNSLFGCWVAGKNWYWYDCFIPIVEKYCKEHNL